MKPKRRRSGKLPSGPASAASISEGPTYIGYPTSGSEMPEERYPIDLVANLIAARLLKGDDYKGAARAALNLAFEEQRNHGCS
jgi:hypothetical protein